MEEVGWWRLGGRRKDDGGRDKVGFFLWGEEM
jgi:hypothetical protein